MITLENIFQTPEEIEMAKGILPHIPKDIKNWNCVNNASRNTIISKANNGLKISDEKDNKYWGIFEKLCDAGKITYQGDIGFRGNATYTKNN